MIEKNGIIIKNEEVILTDTVKIDEEIEEKSCWWWCVHC